MGYMGRLLAACALALPGCYADVGGRVYNESMDTEPRAFVRIGFDPENPADSMGRRHTSRVTIDSEGEIRIVPEWTIGFGDNERVRLYLGAEAVIDASDLPDSAEVIPGQAEAGLRVRW